MKNNKNCSGIFLFYNFCPKPIVLFAGAIYLFAGTIYLFAGTIYLFAGTIYLFAGNIYLFVGNTRFCPINIFSYFKYSLYHL